MANHFIFLGDSITDADRFWLEDHHELGDGYVYRIWEKIQNIGLDIQISNKGYAALTAAGLLERLRRGNISIAPCDKICLLIGINDVGVSMNTGKSLEEQDFETTYEELLRFLIPYGEVICIGPFLFTEPAEYQNWIPEFGKMLGYIKSVAKRKGVQYCELQEYFTEQAEKMGNAVLSRDGIHLTELGSVLLAERILPLLLEKCVWK